jgi:hypothetical protein
MNNHNIERVLNVISHNLCTINGTMDYSRITESITRLANIVMDSETTEETWWIESPYIGLTDLITGAYWHYTEWHGGQSSPEYAALCALGRVYTPNMETPEPENEAYQLLEEMAEESTTV